MHGSENVFPENTRGIFIRLECAFIRRKSGKVSHKTDWGVLYIEGTYSIYPSVQGKSFSSVQNRENWLGLTDSRETTVSSTICLC